METKLLFVFASAVFAAGATAHADTLAVCSIQLGSDAVQQVTVEKWPGGMPANEEHITRLAESGNQAFDIAETFDGSGAVGLGQGTVNKDHTVSYVRWTFGRLPLSFVDFASDVSVSCK